MPFLQKYINTVEQSLQKPELKKDTTKAGSKLTT